MSTAELSSAPPRLLRPEETRQRWMELTLVLFVALAEPIYSSALFALHGGIPRVSGQVFARMLQELSGIAVLFYVLQRRGRGLFYFGKKKA